MSRRMFAGLVVSIFVISSFGNGLMPLFPLCALRVGASQAVAGWYTAFSFLCLAAGALLAGRPGGVLQRRTFMVLLTLVNVPLIMLMGRVTTVWQLTALTGFLWLGGGCITTGVYIIISRHAAETERGRVFGMLGVALGAGAVIGGLGIGELVDRSGYPTMFVVVAGFCLLIPLAFMLLPRVPVPRMEAAAGAKSSARSALRIGPAAVIFLAAQFLAATANGAGNLGRSLLMNAQGFPATAITSTSVMGALIALPLPFALGWLSDRVGRRAVLTASFACGAASLVVLLASRTLWHFWSVGILLALLGVSYSLGPPSSPTSFSRRS